MLWPPVSGQTAYLEAHCFAVHQSGLGTDHGIVYVFEGSSQNEAKPLLPASSNSLKQHSHSQVASAGAGGGLKGGGGVSGGGGGNGATTMSSLAFSHRSTGGGGGGCGGVRGGDGGGGGGGWACGGGSWV